MAVSPAKPTGYGSRSAPLFPLLAVLIWSGNTVISKLAASVISPSTISFYRWLLALLILTPFLVAPTWRNRARIKPYLWKLAVLGMLGMAMYQGFSYIAAQTTSATSMGIMLAIMPLISAVLSSLLAHEPLTRGCVLGGLISLCGVAFLLGRGDPSTLLNAGFVIGDIIMLVAVAAYALYGVLLRRWAIALSTWQSLYIQAGFGMIFILPWFVLTPISPLTAQNIPLLLYASLLASLAAPYVWILAVAKNGPGRASLYINMVPVLVMVIAVVVMGEPLHDYHLIGGALALGGVILGQLWRRPMLARRL